MFVMNRTLAEIAQKRGANTSLLRVTESGDSPVAVLTGLNASKDF